MANENIFSRLRRLLQSRVIIRKRADDRLVVKDLDYSQVGITNNFIDRYSRIHQSTFGQAYANLQRNNYEAQRQELFKDYELMDSDPIIASALDVYADESTIDNVEGTILSIKTDNHKVHDILHNLF